MALSDSEYRDWLEDPDRDPVILIEAGYYDLDTSTEGTFYASDAGYIDDSDTASENYPPIIQGDVIVDEDLNRVLVSPINILWEGEELESFQFLGFDFKIFYGDKSWPRADFRQMAFNKTASFLSVNPEEYQFTFQDIGQAYFDQLIKGNGLGAEVGLPFVFGRIFNLRPRLEYDDIYIYFTPAIINVNVASSVGGTFPSYPEYGSSFGLTITPAAGYPLSDVRDNGVSVHANAQFRVVPDGAGDGLKVAIGFSAAPVGDLTCDNVPHPEDLSPISNFEYYSSLSQILAQINSYAEVTLPIANSVNDFDGIEFGYVCYQYKTTREMLQEMCSSIGANPRVNADGEIELIQIGAPSSPVRVALEGHLVSGLVLEAREPPYLALDLGYRKNWAVQDNSRLAKSVSAADARLYGEEYTYLSDSRSLPEYPFLRRVKVDTLLVNETQAQAELDRRFSLRSVERTRWGFTGDVTYVIDNIGDTITQYTEDYGFDEGEDFVVIRNEKNLSQQICNLRVWK